MFSGDGRMTGLMTFFWMFFGDGRMTERKA
jgi:hypothetical protein